MQYLYHDMQHRFEHSKAMAIVLADDDVGRVGLVSRSPHIAGSTARIEKENEEGMYVPARERESRSDVMRRCIFSIQLSRTKTELERYTVKLYMWGGKLRFPLRESF